MVLHELADQCNTVVVIEHHLDVVETAVRLLDFGPEGGDRPGEIVAVGTPEQIAKAPESCNHPAKAVLKGAG
jgi:excinuclease ABC subunit A